MNRRVRVGRGLAGVASLATTTAVLILAIGGRWAVLVDGFVLHNAIVGLGLGAIAWVALPSQPRNGGVWTLAWSSYFQALYATAVAVFFVTAPASVTELSYAELMRLSPSELPLGSAIVLHPFFWAWVPGVFLFLSLGLLLFPDGRLPAPRWKWVGVVTICAIAVATLGAAWLSRPTSPLPMEQNQTGYDGTLGSAVSLAMFVALLGTLLGAVSLVGRYRRSTGVARVQIRWVAFGGVFLASTILIGTVTEAGESGGDLGSVVALGGLLAFIASLAFAITKYRLYEVDLVISKTLAYGALAVFIGAVYVAIVVGIGALLGQGESASFGLSIIATAVVAIVFQPVRRWVQRWANRLVYGERATPYEVLARFSRRSAELSDEQLVRRIPQLIVDGTGASRATLWVRSTDGFATASVWPQDSPMRRLHRNEVFADPEADYSLPVFHDEELLGGISLDKAAGETITPPEKELLADLAAGMGLAMRNTRLTARLREQVAELEASRERILAAADAARRALEHDLDSGPQQQLVALKVKLGPTRKLAQQAGASKTATILEQLEADAGNAIQAVRDFAGGIYPPLLEAEGLQVAIAQQAHKAAIPISVQGDGIGRYSREVEAAVYFTVLEALQNTAKYAEARSASVSLVSTGGALRFQIRDDGRGFDRESVNGGVGLAGMADRLDAVGGTVQIESAPGHGTVVTGSIPMVALVSA